MSDTLVAKDVVQSATKERGQLGGYLWEGVGEGLSGVTAAGDGLS